MQKMGLRVGDKIKYKNGKAIYTVVIINSDNTVYARIYKNNFGKPPNSITLWRLNLNFCKPIYSNKAKIL